MRRHNDTHLDDLVRQAVGVDAREVARAWSSQPAQRDLLQEIFSLPATTTVDAPPGPDPRTHRGRLTALASAAALILVVVVGVLAWPSQTSPVFAGWTTSPQPVTAEARDVVERMCGDDVARGTPADVIDQRGGAAVARWWHAEGASQTELGCWLFDTDGDGTFDAGVTSETLGPIRARGPESYGEETVQARGPDGVDHEIRMWTGRVGPDVDRVVAIRNDGTEVEASLADDGYFLVWWPAVGDVPELEQLVTRESRAGSVTHESWTPAP